MGMRAADGGRMRHIGHRVVVNVLALAKQEAPVFDALHAVAYPFTGLTG